MRLITRADIDLVATLALCARMGNAGKVLRALRDKFEDPRADPRAVLEYGLCRAMFLLNDPNDSDKGPHQVAAAQAFSRCLDLDARWWLPRFLRMEINSVLAGALPDAAAEPPERDVEALLSLQAQAVEAPPYFVSTHAARLRATLRTSPDGAAAAGAVEEFTASAAAIGVAPARFSLAYLDLPFRESVLLLRHLGHDAAAASVRATGLAVYPESLPLQLA
jgi:hypothetical protein